MKLSYWIATQNDHPIYHIRRRTRKAVYEAIETSGNPRQDYSEPKKVEVVYTDGFDLMDACLSNESAAFWER